MSTTRYGDTVRIGAGTGVSVNIGVTASSSPALSGFTQAVLLWATSNCWVDWMPSTASAGTGLYIAASQYAVINAMPGSIISVVQDATAGILRVKPLVE